MKPEDLQELKDSMNESIKEAHLIGLQSGKQETSGLVDTIMHKMENNIEISINKNVNGKIKNLDLKIDDYIKSDMAWKDKYSPYLEGLQGITVSGKILLWLAIFVSSIIGVFKLLK